MHHREEGPTAIVKLGSFDAYDERNCYINLEGASFISAAPLQGHPNGYLWDRPSSSSAGWLAGKGSTIIKTGGGGIIMGSSSTTNDDLAFLLNVREGTVNVTGVNIGGVYGMFTMYPGGKTILGAPATVAVLALGDLAVLPVSLLGRRGYGDNALGLEPPAGQGFDELHTHGDLVAGRWPLPRAVETEVVRQRTARPHGAQVLH